MNKQDLIEKMNTLLQNVEPLKFALEISTDQDEIDYLRSEIKTQYLEINTLREVLNLVRGN